MPKQSPKTRPKTQRQKTPQRPRKRTLVWLVVGLIAIGVVWVTLYSLVISPRLDERDKQRFVQAQTEIDRIVTEEIVPIAQPDEIITKQSCRYSGMKYEKGNLSCLVTSSMVYADINSYDEALDKTQAISSVLAEETAAEVSEDQLSNIENSFWYYQKFESNGLSCNISYNYSSNLDDGLIIDTSCVDSARAEHFPVE